jgi:hypothetical protein
MYAHRLYRSLRDHPPSNCIDIEPSGPPKASGIVINNATMSDALGGLVTGIASNVNDAVLNGGTYTCQLAGACGNTGLVALIAPHVVIENATFNGEGFRCGGHFNDPVWIRTDVRNNTFNMKGTGGIFCFDQADTLGIPVHFVNNILNVDGTVVENGRMQFQYAAEVRGNTFFVSKNAKFGTNTNTVEYTGADVVMNNTYSTDLTNASNGYSAIYTGARLVCNEISLQPTFFVLGPENVPTCPTSKFTGTLSQGATIQ